jgi:hypothetical protein
MDILTNIDISHLSITDLVDGTMFFAQQFKQFDIIADGQKAWNNFIETGQVWALLIGMFFGYIFKSFTSF